MGDLFGSIPQAALDYFAQQEDNVNSSKDKKGSKKRSRSDSHDSGNGAGADVDDEFVARVLARKAEKKQVSTLSCFSSLLHAKSKEIS